MWAPYKLVRRRIVTQGLVDGNAVKRMYRASRIFRMLDADERSCIVHYWVKNDAYDVLIVRHGKGLVFIAVYSEDQIEQAVAIARAQGVVYCDSAAHQSQSRTASCGWYSTRRRATTRGRRAHWPTARLAVDCRGRRG